MLDLLLAVLQTPDSTFISAWAALVVAVIAIGTVVFQSGKLSDRLDWIVDWIDKKAATRDDIALLRAQRIEDFQNMLKEWPGSSRKVDKDVYEVRHREVQDALDNKVDRPACDTRHTETVARLENEQKHLDRRVTKLEDTVFTTEK